MLRNPECTNCRVLRDIRYALRTLRQNPGFALVAIVSLALGIGANSAIFSLADGLLLRPMPVPHASGVIAVQSQVRGENIGGLAQYALVSYKDYKDLRDGGQSFSGLAAAQFLPFGFATEKGAVPQMKFGNLVSGNYFQVLSVTPAIGRAFGPDEDRVPGRDAVVVLSYDLWKTEFGGRSDIVGQTAFLNGIAFTVIGVAPESFKGPENLIRSALYVPLAMASQLAGDPERKLLEDRAGRVLYVQGRLRPGVSLAQAVAETRLIGQQIARAYPETNKTCSLDAATEIQSRFRQGTGNELIVGFLLALAAVVLLIACANVMNLMLSRGWARSREIAVRLAVGAGRVRLLRQLLIESLVIAVLGGAAGLFLAQAGADLFSSIRVPGDIPLAIDIHLDARVLWFALALSVVSALLFGLAPALRITRPDLVPALKSGRAEGGKRRSLLGRNALVVAQVAGSLLLLVFASQSYRGASVLLSSPIGFRTEHLLMAGFDPSLARYTPERSEQFYKRLLEKARALRGVKTAALTSMVPMWAVNGGATRVAPEGFRLPPGTSAVLSLSATVSEDYFTTMGVKLVAGREFSVTDRAGAPRVAIVNERFARKYFPNQSAVGKRVRLNGPDGPPIEIVGVAQQTKYLFPVEPPIEYMYLPLAQNPQTAMTLLLYTAVPPGAVSEPLREMVRSLDAGQPIVGLRTMEEYFDQRARQTLNVLNEAIGGLGILGLVLALVGLYGLMTYSVGLRQREIGIRMAIGADTRGVLTMVLKQGMLLAGSGVAIGLLVSLVAGKPATNAIGAAYFYLPLVAAVVIALLAAAALGAYVPARRASLLDPNIVLRQE